MSAVVAEEPVAPGPVELRVDAAVDEYRFAATTADGTEVALGWASTRYVSTEVAGGFTGVHIGPYAAGDGRTADATARFEAFSCVATE